nr:hypothetical protein CTI12_AA507610 [Tanacetum cinerariifolium]
MTDVASTNGTKTNSHVANYNKTKIVASNPFDVLNMLEKDVGAASSGTVSSKGDMADVNVSHTKTMNFYIAIAMDKSWMNIVHRLTISRYELGVKEFLKFAYRLKNKSLLIPCPCKICDNFRNHKKRIVYSHLMQNGISAGYDEWTHHGESCDVLDDDSDDDDVSFNDEEARSDNMNGDNDDDDDADDDLDEMLDNIGQGTWGDKWKTSVESSSSIDKDLESLRRLLEESHQELYTGCQSYSKFSFIVTMLHLKTTNGWSNKSFNDTLNVFKKALPSPSSVPTNFYEAKKYIRDLGFRGEKIHACVNDCVLYRGKYKSLAECPNKKCTEPRFKKKNLMYHRRCFGTFP